MDFVLLYVWFTSKGCPIFLLVCRLVTGHDTDIREAAQTSHYSNSNSAYPYGKSLFLCMSGSFREIIQCLDAVLHCRVVVGRLKGNRACLYLSWYHYLVSNEKVRKIWLFSVLPYSLLTVRDKLIHWYKYKINILYSLNLKLREQSQI